MWYYPDDVAPADLKFPGFEGPVFVAQLFSMVDSAASVASVACTPWKVIGFAWIVLVPLPFCVYASYRVRQLIHESKTLQYASSPAHTLVEMRGKIKAAQSLLSRMSYCWIFCMDFRFKGTWKPADKTARQWVWIMAAFTDEHVYGLSWTLFKKIVAAFIKNWLDVIPNCLANLVLFSFDSFVFMFTPYRDRTCDACQIAATLANLLAVVSAALPVFVDPDSLPLWLDSMFTVSVMTIGTAVMAIQALFTPAFLVGRAVSQLQRPSSGLCGVGRRISAALSYLSARVWIILMVRGKAAASQHIQAEAAAQAADSQDTAGLVRTISHVGKALKKGLTNPSYKERLLVLTGGTLSWYKPDEVDMGEGSSFGANIDQFHSRGRWWLGGTSVEAVESKDDTYYQKVHGRGFGLTLSCPRQGTRRFMFKLESSRDAWLEKLQLVTNALSNLTDGTPFVPSRADDGEMVSAHPEREREKGRERGRERRREGGREG